MNDQLPLAFGKERTTFGSAPSFSGETFDKELDAQRLNTLLNRVFAVLGDYEWHTLRDLAGMCMGSEASVSARIRDLRKQRFGAHVIERRRKTPGVWEYRLVM